MATIRFEKAQRWYDGVDKPAVRGIDLEVGDGEFMVLVGPSGCGKSTTLRMLAGLERTDSGRIWIGDRDITTASPRERDIAMVFQNYALYPHMTVADNMSFALRMAGVGAAERRRRVEEAATMLDLTDYLDRRPKALSGGQRQRVAMGRAIVRQPQVFCMDEPLSNLDAKMRVQTRTDIARLQADLGVTTVYVTHDQVEAMTMGDRVAVMKDGELQQVDDPLRLYDEPVNQFVASFIGSPQMSFLPARLGEDRALVGADHTVPVTVPAGATGRDVVVGVRPEGWRLVGPNDGGLPVRVSMVEDLGADTFLYGTCEVADSARVVARVPARHAARRDDVVHVLADPDRVHLFDSEDGRRIPAP